MGIDKLSGHTIVCGYGRIGRTLALELHAAGRPFVVVDQDAEAIHQAQEEGFLVVHGDAADEETLDRAGIKRAGSLATVLPVDAVNVFITLAASEMNPSMEIIARAEDPHSERKLLRSGATRVILPAAIGALRIAQMIVHSGAENFLAEAGTRSGLNQDLNQIGLQFDELLIPEGSSLVGKRLADVEVKGKGGFLVVALRRSDGTLQLNPLAEHVLSAKETLVVVGHQDDLPQLVERYTEVREVSYRGQKSTIVG